LDDVLNGRADVALQDGPSVAQYVAAHPGKVKALWLDSPPSLTAASFLTRPGDVEFTSFLSGSIHVLKVDGTLRNLDEKWKTYGLFDRLNTVPGAGLSQ
jgi:ABC-type amino acid transport substrate-binding protein